MPEFILHEYFLGGKDVHGESGMWSVANWCETR